jgi:hypothetical protein
MKRKSSLIKPRGENPSLVDFVIENYIPLFYWAGCVFAGNAWKFGTYLFPDSTSMHHYVVSQTTSGGSLVSTIIILLLIKKTKVASVAMCSVILIMNIIAEIGSILASMNIHVKMLSQVDGIKDVWLEYILFFTIFAVGYLFYVFNDRNNAMEVFSNNSGRDSHLYDDKISSLKKEGGVEVKGGVNSVNPKQNTENYE